jgi:hypothetical protein
MVVAEEEIHFLASKKKIDFLRQIQNSNKDENGLPAKLELHIRDRVSIMKCLTLDLLIIMCEYLSLCHPCWSSGSILTLDPRFSGSYLAKDDDIFKGEKMCTVTSFRGDVKSQVPCCRFIAC